MSAVQDRQRAPVPHLVAQARWHQFAAISQGWQFAFDAGFQAGECGKWEEGVESMESVDGVAAWADSITSI